MAVCLNTGELGCLEVKVIGKPYAGEPQVLDQGEQDFVLWKILNGHEMEAAATAKG